MAVNTNVQTPAFQQQVQALQNLAQGVSGTPAASASTPGGASQAPSDAVAQYQNQQLGGLSTGTSNQTTPGSAQPGSVLASATPGSVEDIANQAIQNQQQSSQVQLGLSQAIGARLKAQQQAAQQPVQSSGSGSSGTPTTTYSGGGMGSNAPRAYQNNPALSAARNEALSTAYSYIGDRYVLGGTTHAGIDCSGLVMAVYDQLGFGKYINNHSSAAQAQEIPGVRTSVSNLQPGDLVAWQGGGHIAVYAGNGMIVAAAAPGEGVKYQPVWGNVYGIHLTLPGE